MDKNVKKIYEIAGQIQALTDDDEILKLKIEFDNAIHKFLEESGDGITTLYTSEYTTLTQQRIIDDAIQKIVNSLISQEYLTTEVLGDFFDN